MKVTKQAIGRISRRIKIQMKVYQKAVSSQHRPYLEEMVFSLPKDPSVFVAQVARHLGGGLMITEKRLPRLLHSPKMPWGILIQGHLERLKTYVKQIPFDKLLIYADLSDLAKGHAQKMPDLGRVRDGSESSKKKAKIKPGSWLSEIYAQFPQKKIFTAVFYPFSTIEKGFRPQTNLILHHRSLVFEALAGVGLWISGRGYENLKFFCAPRSTAGNFSSALSSIGTWPARC